ncbi:MAG: class I SAM-dependent methyltransferase [Gammaproteobacteria bacterium]|nr:class I SAM-dependent methyltransferase [Gammaproteobacteria bacterium]
MKRLTHYFLTTLIFALTTALPAGADCISDALTKAAEGEHRAAAHVARNQYRHPVETLKFFGVTPQMTVVEISPGGSGWYTEILAPFLRDHGALYLGSYDPESSSEYYRRNAKKFADKLAAHPEVYDKAILGIFDPAGKMDAAPAGSADLVVTFRNTHNWASRGNAEAAFVAMYDYLKPGGVLGLVQHRGKADQVYSGEDGYLSESQVITMAEAAGFVLLDKSEINANPRDTKDHPSGVWSLPPGYRLDGHEDMKDAMTAIGESDRMTLKFMRPVKVKNESS